MRRASGDRYRHSGLSRSAAHTSSADDNRTISHTALVETTPCGSSRLLVRGLAASIWRSARRLNPMAALRAPTIASAIQPI